jgi:hypothetical protein
MSFYRLQIIIFKSEEKIIIELKNPEGNKSTLRVIKSQNRVHVNSKSFFDSFDILVPDNFFYGIEPTEKQEHLIMDIKKPIKR